MNRLKKIFVLVLVAVVVSFGMAGCKHEGEHPSGEAVTEEAAPSEHPTTEHPTTEHPAGEHPE